MNEFHHSKCSSKKQYVSALQILWTGKRMLQSYYQQRSLYNQTRASLINIRYNHPCSNVILWNAKQQYVHDIWAQTKIHYFTHNSSTLRL